MSSDEESVPVNRIVMARPTDPTASPAPSAPAIRKYQRLPRTEAQKAATMKGLEALARRRAEMEIAKEKARLEKLEKAEELLEPPKSRARAPKQPPQALPGALTPDMLDKIKSQIREEVESEKKKLHEDYQERKKTKSKKRTVIIEEESESSSGDEEVIVKRRKPKAASEPAAASTQPQTVGKQRLLSGSDLLDSIFSKH